MEISGFWSYVVLEALGVASILAVYLIRKNQRLSAQLAKMKDQDGSQALDIDTPLDPVTEETLDTEVELAELADEPEAETGSGQEDQSTLIEALQTRIKSYETRVSNLEQFKQLFFDLKMQQINSKGLNEKIRAEVDKAIPEQDQAPELKTTLASLRAENSTLEDQLTHIEQELDDVLRAAGPAAENQEKSRQTGVSRGSTVQAEIDHDVEDIRQVISEYKKHVHELNGLVMNLKLDVQDKERLEHTCEKLNAQYENLQGVMGHLEEENEFLQEQISALLKQELEKDEEAKVHAVEEKARIEEQLKAATELEVKYAEMEQLYLTTYQENQRLKNEAAGSS